LQELHRPPNFGHQGIWYKIGDGQPQLHILVRSEATLRRDKWIDLADIHFALRVESYRDTLAWLGSKGFRDDLPDDDFRKMQLRPNSPAGYGGRFEVARISKYPSLIPVDAKSFELMKSDAYL
jgi:hypothetical protein